MTKSGLEFKPYLQSTSQEKGEKKRLQSYVLNLLQGQNTGSSTLEIGVWALLECS